MSDTIPTLEQYKLEKDPRKLKIEHLKALKKDSSQSLTLGNAEQEKLTQRFPNADNPPPAKGELEGGVKLDISPYAITLVLTFLDYNDAEYDAKSKDNNAKIAWTKLTDDSLDLKDFHNTITSDIIWQRADCYQLLLFIYGAERIDFIERAWQDMPTRSFQTGWGRRSFRISADNEAYFYRRISFLQESSRASGESWGDEYYDLPKHEKVRWAWNFYRTHSPLEWSAELDMAEDLEQNKLFCLMRDIVYNRDESGEVSGKVSREIIKALLASKRVEAWGLVKDLLLTAQRQEGLRQTILEALDEGSREAIPYFIDVIIDNNLTRFSSVVRAIDTWTGMEWEADKSTACKKFLQSAKQFFDNPVLLDKKIESHNNLDVLSALWAVSIDDVSKTVPMIEQLIKSEKIEKVALAMYFVNQWCVPALENPLYLQVLQSEKLSSNLLSLASALTPLSQSFRPNFADGKPTETQNNATLLNDTAEAKKLYQCLQGLLKQSNVKQKTFEGKVFNWLNFTYYREHISRLMSMIALTDLDSFSDFISQYKDELSLSTREDLARRMYNGRAYDFDKKWCIRNRDDAKTLTDIQRYFAMQFVGDRAEGVSNICAKLLIRGKLLSDELPIIEELFSNKGKLLGKRLQYIMLGQSSEIVMTMAEKLLKSDNTQQRVAGLELALELSQSNNTDNKQAMSTADKTKISTLVNNYEDNLPKSKNGKVKSLTKAEISLLERFDMVEDGQLTEANGWGLYDPSNISPYNKPTFDENSYFASIAKLPHNTSNKGKHEFGLSKPLTDMIADLEQLKQLYLDNADYEYEMENWNDSKEMVLLGNSFQTNNRKLEVEDGQKYFDSYPLWQTWENWFTKVKWTARDLFIFSFEIEESYYWGDNDSVKVTMMTRQLPDYLPTAKKQLPKFADGYYYLLSHVLGLLAKAHPFTEKNQYFLSACECLYANLSDDILQWQSQDDERHERNGDGWQSLANSSVFLTRLGMDFDICTPEEEEQAWHLYRWRQMNGLEHNINKLYPPLAITAKAYRLGLINKDELMASLLTKDGNSLSSLSDLQVEEKREYLVRRQQQSQAIVDDAPILLEMMADIREYCLDIELKRGEVETPVSQFVAQFNRFYGLNRLIEAITTLGKKNLYANYLYGGGTKTQMMSYVIAHCYPLDSDDQATFSQAVTKAGISDERLVQIGVYASQWQPFVEAHLQWDGLASGIWWMNAHTKTSEYESKSAEVESEIAKYSTIDLNEFKRGAVDIDWFNKAYGLLGKKRWGILYDCAKFVSDGNGHRRAKLYSDVLTGELKIREVTKKVKDKRDQDFLRLYGLVPLSKTNGEKDVLTRYTYLQQFKKESRQFGSQRQASEGLAVQVSMDNLARTAGYPDPLRLGWAMESKTVQEIFAVKNGKLATKLELDDIVIELLIDENGKADIIVEKAGKIQKSIPAKYRKHAAVEQLKKHKKTLTEQFRRAKKSLEESMVRGDVFTAKELGELFTHPVISKLLEKLVFVTDSDVTDSKDIQLGFYVDGKLVNAKNEESTLQDDSPLRIAHCVDFHQANVWREYQGHCFTAELKQPFKQIFRELYLPTPDELAEKTISRRYAGHQVQPAKTVALLKSRGWRVDYEEGLQKVYHSEGFRVKLYAMADWFSPADTESPTLETVEFQRLRKLEGADEKLSYNVPFEEVDQRIFSEIMRDIDLVVSVAHVGDVDPEASQSSIELREVLLAETLRLFKLDNVEINGKHAIIDGTMAKYSVHLGSAVAHQVAGSYLSILPVHSQHRGRIFLPFMDDDPKTAELMAKVLLLAKDNEIQDPTVLRQITMK